MKSATLKTKRGINQGKFTFTGEELADRNSYAPIGFYTNVGATAFSGIVFRDRVGNCTYFDRAHGCVYELDKNVWKNAMFTWQYTMSSISVKLTD